MTIPHSFEKIIFFKIISDALITTIFVSGISLILLHNIEVILIIAVFCLLVSMGYISFGIVLAIIMKDPIKYQIVFSLLIIPMLIVSGGIFPLDWYENKLKTLALFNPVSYNIDFIRSLLSQPHKFNIIYSFIISNFISMALLLICLLYSKYFKINV